ncbi:acyltransferase [Paenibacillus sp. GP183]|uniref:acyltransferase n=1 Tax=Paenibacillus sp. GP183 TaxID=1882751 RepID=UPI00089C1077|nr:acyltransferase [Paenibacillus sp. GP183]SEC07609.1 transferase hexapeptide (six repeat-containing protein) [Paenibacillus sp. GP183]
MNILKKIVTTLISECRSRGSYYTAVMNISHAIGILRGFLNKLLYFKSIKSSIFSLQANSRIEVFSKHAKIEIGKFVFIRKNVSIRVDDDGELQIADKVFINDNCTINCASRISIGRNTKIAPNVCINDHDHNYKNADKGHLVKGEVVIGENVWIGSNAVILRDTFIGDNAVIAAGSVVKGNVPANTLFINKREKSYIPYAASL